MWTLPIVKAKQRQSSPAVVDLLLFLWTKTFQANKINLDIIIQGLLIVF